jgi:predicted nucleic acid-binding protein
VQEALRAVDTHQLAFWDALIWAVAAINDVHIILTEDLPRGRAAIEGVRYANPLAPSFDINRIGVDW